MQKANWPGRGGPKARQHRRCLSPAFAPLRRALRACAFAPVWCPLRGMLRMT